MTNSITVDPTKFENVRTGRISYGYRIYDSTGGSYDCTWTEEDMRMDDLAILRRVIEDGQRADLDNESVFVNIISGVREYKDGMYVANTYYPWDAIKDFFKHNSMDEDENCFTGECAICGPLDPLDGEFGEEAPIIGAAHTGPVDDSEEFGQEVEDDV